MWTQVLEVLPNALQNATATWPSTGSSVPIMGQQESPTQTPCTQEKTKGEREANSSEVTILGGETGMASSFMLGQQGGSPTT